MNENASPIFQPDKPFIPPSEPWLDIHGAEFRVRAIRIDGAPWFVAKDVCDVLDIRNSRDAVEKLDGDERSAVAISDTRSKGDATQRREMTVVNESGLYALIFQSRKPEARVFRRWVTGTVLPALREGRMPELQTPATRIVEVDMEIAQMKEALVRKMNHSWRIKEVPGNVSIKVFTRAAKIDITTREAMSLGATLAARARGLGYDIGRIRQRRCRYGLSSIESTNEDRAGWQSVATFPPGELHAECIRRGFCDEGMPCPSEEALAAAAAPLLCRGPYRLTTAALSIR